MKTIDEVIERFEDDLHAAEADSQLIMLFDRDVVDAIHYLKEYSSKQDTIAEQLAELEQKNDHVCELAKTVCEEYDRLCNRLAEEYSNDALSWDELKQMEGKPVWIETSDSFNRRRWMFVGEWFDEDEMRLFDMGNDYPDYVSKNGYESGTWQAYQKERKNE